ncbi:MAG: LptF/LptG family permease, partial [Phycisphaerae bacterium]|nr:LptF/LptG family permease [Phycisphaerae bacterium]
MKRIDRYITKMFLINYVILFVVVVGLIVLLDLISNFDEFLQYADRVESSFLGRTVRTLGAMVDFYGPLVFLLFAYLAGLLPVAAGGFTLAAMIRNRELLAMLASGIGMHRIVAPIFVIAFLTTLLMVANQELVLPQFAQKLSRKRADIKYGGFRTFAVQFVPDGSGALFTAARFDPQSEMMHDVAILRRFRLGENRFGQAGERIVAQQATWDATRGGWELTNGFSVPRTVKAAEGEDTFAARRPRPVEFLASDLDPVTLLMRKRSRFRELMSIP